MGATSFYALPYPDPGSTVDVPRDVKALADKLELWKDGFTVPNGNVIASAFNTSVGGVARPLPFSTWGGTVTVAVTAQVANTTVVNIPAGRFTQTPLYVIGGVNASASNFAIYIIPASSPNNLTQFTLGIRHVDNAAATQTVFINVLAFQMTAAASAG